MLVAKLDYLQLLVIKGSLTYLGKQTSRLWRAIKLSADTSMPEDATSEMDSRCGCSCAQPTSCPSRFCK